MSGDQQSQKKFLDQLPVAVCVCDRQGRVTEFNRQATELWGREPEAGARFCGAARLYDFRGRLVEPDVSPVACVLRFAAAQRNVELVIERPDGGRVTVLSNTAPQFSADGELLGAMEVFHDITERRWSEEARRVSERLCASARVASQVTEQLRKPLHSVTSLLDILRQEGNLSAEARTCMELIEQELLCFDQLSREMVHLSTAA